MRLQGCFIDADPPMSSTTAAGTLAVASKRNSDRKHARPLTKDLPSKKFRFD